MVAAKNTGGPLAAIASRNQRQNFTSFAFGALVFEGGGPAASLASRSAFRSRGYYCEIPPIAFFVLHLCLSQNFRLRPKGRPSRSQISRARIVISCLMRLASRRCRSFCFRSSILALIRCTAGSLMREAIQVARSILCSSSRCSSI